MLCSITWGVGIYRSAHVSITNVCCLTSGGCPISRKKSLCNTPMPSKPFFYPFFIFICTSIYRLDIRYHPELRHAVHDHGRNHHHQWSHALHHPVYHTSPQPTAGQHQYEERHVSKCRRTLDVSETTAVKTFQPCHVA